MYKLPYFTESNKDEVINFMQQYSFITLICNDGKQSVATQIPVLFDIKKDEVVLRAHIMRKTDHHLAIEQNKDVLVLFQGPHCYVSSSWYTEKMGATWNYLTVHARGTTKFLDDKETIELLGDLTAQYEANQEQPLLIQDMPEGHVSSLVKAIIGIEIKLYDIYPIFKLSQNRDDGSYINIVKHLLKSEDKDAHIIAAEMQKRRPGLFQS
ncbi:MAG: FMN-binding negative transcriptional regulator [Flavipsychrobacter sp.]